MIAFVGAILVVSAVAPAAGAVTDPGITFVESDVTTDTTWTPADGPYRIIRDVEVDPGATLTVAPGTSIEIAEDITVTVSGSLRTNGTAARPVAITRSSGAAAERRWETLRYNGTTGSVLDLRHTTIAGGDAGITVASDDGRVRVVDSTVRDFTTAGVAVTGTTATPPIAVRRSTFRGIGGHAIRASPGAGTVDRVSLRATPDAIGETADHTLELEPGVGVSFDSIRLSYASDGSVASVGAGSIERIGLDRNRNGSIDRSFAGSVASVSSTDSRLEISLSESVEIPSDGRLIVEYDDAVNPTTRGIYPVAVRLRDGGLERLATGVEAAFVVGSVVSPTDAAVDPDQPTTRVRGLAVLESTFRGIDGAGVFVAADRVRRLQASRNRIDGVGADGISVRAEESETYFLGNEITGVADGIRIAASDETTVTADRNRIRNARTGIRLRQSGTDSLADGTLALRRNRLTDNRVHGVGIDTDSLELTVDAANNSVGDNGRDGISVSGWRVRGGRIRDNDVVGNAAAGVSVRTDAGTRGVAVRNNTLADNGGHGLELRSELVVYGVSVADNRLTNNAGAGLVVSSPVTHRANLSVASNVVAANAYGIVLRGVFGTTVRDNEVVFNTNRFADPVALPDVEPGTAGYVAEGAAGAIVDRGDSEIPLEELVSDPDVDAQLEAVTLGDGLVAVLRTDEAASTRSVDAAAVRIRGATDDVPTGIRIPKTGPTNDSYRFTDNGIYGHERGLTVDVAPLVTTNTTAVVLTEPTRTVDAESNYWGSAHGPYHSSILPAGEGNAVVTRRGWVDFVPFRATPAGPEYARPTAALDVPPTPVSGSEVGVSGAGSTAAQGSVARYRFRIDGDRLPATDGAAYRFGMPNRSVDVALVVEDSLGIDSAVATATIRPGTATPASTPTPQPATATPGVTPSSTPTRTPEPEPEPTLLGSLGSIPGLVGGVCYLLALAVGAYGVTLTITNRSPPVEGLQVQGLAGLGVVIWIVAGLVGGGPLLAVGLAGAALWVALTGVAYVIVTRGLLDDVLG